MNFESNSPQLKAEILRRFPRYTSHGVFRAIAIKLWGRRSEYRLSVDFERFSVSQYAVLAEYKGKEYTLYFGRLHG